jgi:hypothetical protein
VTGPWQDGYAAQQELSPQQEELVRYLGELTARELPPTRAMIQNFASNILKKHIGEIWVTHFIRRNRNQFISKWSAGINATRLNANSKRKYELYFDLLHHKINQNNVQPHNIYNMDGKRLHDWHHGMLKTGVQLPPMGFKTDLSSTSRWLTRVDDSGGSRLRRWEYFITKSHILLHEQYTPSLMGRRN